MSTSGVGRFSPKLENFANSDPVVKVSSSGSRKFEFGGKQVSLNHIIEEFERELGNQRTDNMSPEKAEMAKNILIRLKELKTNQSPINNIFSSAMKQIREATNRAFGREERLDALEQKVFLKSNNLDNLKQTLTISYYERHKGYPDKVEFLDHDPNNPLFLSSNAGKLFAYIDEKTDDKTGVTTRELKITGMSRDLKTAYDENIGSIKGESKSDIKNLFLENDY